MCGGAEKSTCTTSLRIGHVGSHGACEGPGMGEWPHWSLGCSLNVQCRTK